MKKIKNKKIVFKNLSPIIPSLAYDTYWKFAYERQNVFFRKLEQSDSKLTDDPIIGKHKFTNTYRICDRASQYLVKSVIYTKEPMTERDILLRILLFKLFNKIETWELLENKFGVICENTFSVKKYKRFLDTEMNNGRVLYNNAYMMASGCGEFKVTRKHHAHLLLLEKMLKSNLPEKIQECRRMSDGYDLLLGYPMIGKFLAYQFITDINYSELTNFSESEFTVPGPGARDGIRKCFSDLGGLSETDIIKLMAERQEFEFERLGLDFKTIGNRPLQFIDIQNVFCETDKYCRVAHPEIEGISGRTRIKQLYKPNHTPIQFYFPPKWKIKLRI